MKLKNLILGLGLSVLGLFAQAQTGLENIIVERYYTATAADVAASTGALAPGSVTYRIYADMLPGYKFQAAYGTPTHTLFIHTTTSFFNNEDRGSTIPSYTKAQAASNTVMLDSWLSVGAGCAGQFGVPLSEDNGVATVVHPAGVLTALAANDGLLAPPSGTTLQGLTMVGPQVENGILIFDATSQAGNDFTLTDGAWSALSGAIGPFATNRILLGQFTTDGIFSFELNMQLGTPTGGAEKFVAKNSLDASETVKSFLTQTLYPGLMLPTVSITAPANNATYAPGAAITFSATAADVDGTITKIEFFQGTTSLGLGVLAAGVYTLTLPTGLPEQVAAYSITAKATDNDNQVATSAPVSINVGNAPPAATLTAPAAGTSYILGDAVTVSATATDPDGTVASVAFFNGATSLGNGTFAAGVYSLTFTPSAIGPISLTAKATDNLGKQGAASVAVSISVVANQLPTVAITAPLNNATPALNAPLTLTATASDADGTITSVEFFNGVTSLGNGTLAAGVYSLTFSPSVQGAITLTAKATDNKGGVKVSAPINVVITDLSAAYALGTVSQACNIGSVCLPITTNNTTVANVNGYNFSVKYDKTKVIPTGNVTVNNALVLPLLTAGKDAEYITDYTTTIDATNGIINIGIFFNSNAGSSASFNGNNTVCCVEFNKTAAFLSVDTAKFSFTEIIESYQATGAVYKSGSDGKLITYKEDKMLASLKFWSDLSPIKYDATNPASYLVSNILGCGSTVNAVQPDLSGNFVYSILNGTTIDIKRDILNSTNVHGVIDAQDAYLTALTSVKGTSTINWTPSVYQMIAMDVNRDGLITAGDATQINQRAVRLIGEFVQIGGLAKDWSFVANSVINSDLSYLKSVSFPENDTKGYSKYKVPVVAICQNVPVLDAAGCPTVLNESYLGILIGDVNATYAGIANDGLLKSSGASAEIVFDLSQAVKNGGDISIPVSLNTTEVVNSFDFDVVLNDLKASVKSVDSQNGVNLSWNYISTDKMLSVASFSLNAIPTQNTASLTMTITGVDALNSADFNSTLAKINGRTAQLKVIDATTGLAPGVNNNSILVYPNPTSDVLNIEVSSDSKVQMMDLNGKLIGGVRNINANEKQVIDVKNLASGVYMMKIYNDKFVKVQRVVINR